MKEKEGYIKFQIQNECTPIITQKQISRQINKIRLALKEKNMIGVCEQNISFGNISQRISDNEFVITATNTGKSKYLKQKDFALVYNSDIDKNTIYSKGIQLPSSESLSHAAIYKANNLVKAVIHIHSQELWNKYYDNIPSISPEFEYGTSLLAYQIYQKVKTLNTNNGIILLQGHENGIISFGESLKIAMQKIQDIERSSSQTTINKFKGCLYYHNLNK